MLVGFLLEGWDHLIIRAYLAKILAVPEDQIDADQVGEASGRGWGFVMRSVDIALRRFYHRRAQLAVVGADNDGNRDLEAESLTEDPLHRRHWMHEGQVDEVTCRHCRLSAVVEAVRLQLHWLPRKPGHSWPIVLAIPVEAIETWLLVTRAIVNPGRGALGSESDPRRVLKGRFYGRPTVTRLDVEEVALPMIRSLTLDQIEILKHHASSFRSFWNQVDGYRNTILGDATCWEPIGP